MDRLPIDVVPNTNPPIFRWRSMVDTMGGVRTQELTGRMMPSLETPILELILLVKRQAEEIKVLEEDYKVLEEECDAANRRVNSAETLNSNQRQMLDEQKQPKKSK